MSTHYRSLFISERLDDGNEAPRHLMMNGVTSYS